MSREPFGDFRDEMTKRYAARYTDALEPVLPQIARAREDGDEALAEQIVLDALKDVSPSVAAEMMAELIERMAAGKQR